MNQAKFIVFGQAYTAGLKQAVVTEPEEYMLAAGETAEQYAGRVAGKMLSKLETAPMGLNYDGNGFKLTCKALGIKYTRKAIFEYLEIQK